MEVSNDSSDGEPLPRDAGPEQSNLESCSAVPDSPPLPPESGPAATEFSLPPPAGSPGEDEIDLELRHGGDVFDSEIAPIAEDVVGLRNIWRDPERSGGDFALFAQLAGETELRRMYTEAMQRGDLARADQAFLGIAILDPERFREALRRAINADGNSVTDQDANDHDDGPGEDPDTDPPVIEPRLTSTRRAGPTN